MSSPRPHLRRKVKPKGARYPAPNEYECSTCGKEPVKCSECYALTCASCAIPWEGKVRCSCCQRPLD